MFGRRRETPKPSDTSRPAIGVGMLVAIGADARGRMNWRDEPVGVVISPGSGGSAGYPGINTIEQATWVVAFADPAFTVDGSGPFEQATINSRELTPIPVENDQAKSASGPLR